jgi:hypothetical protein
MPEVTKARVKPRAMLLVTGVLFRAQDEWDRLIRVVVDASMQLVETEWIERFVHPMIEQIAVFHGFHKFLKRRGDRLIGPLDDQVEVCCRDRPPAKSRSMW